MAIMTMGGAHTEAALLDGARALRPLIEASSDQIERECQLTDPVVEALASAGLFTMLVPRELGGSQVDPDTCVRVLEELGRADGSTAWCVMVAAVTSIAAGTFPEDVAVQIWGSPPRASVAGSAVGSGEAIAVDGGYRVSGHWSFASGCRNSAWMMAMPAVIHTDGKPRLDPNGQPETRFTFLPRADCRIVETWNVTGLRGTGSHDFIVEDTFVPEALTLPRSYSTPPRHPGELYRFGAGAVPVASALPGGDSPWIGVSSIGMAAVTLGIARGALDAFVELATTKRPGRRATVLRDDPVVQDRFGRTEARLRAARAFLYETIADVWQRMTATGAGTTDGQTLLRLASAHAAETAVEVVETIWKLAGTSGIFLGSPFERRLRDVQVGAQNVTISPMYFATAGQMLLRPGDKC